MNGGVLPFLWFLRTQVAGASRSAEAKLGPHRTQILHKETKISWSSAGSTLLVVWAKSLTVTIDGDLTDEVLLPSSDPRPNELAPSYQHMLQLTNDRATLYLVPPTSNLTWLVAIVAIFDRAFQYLTFGMLSNQIEMVPTARILNNVA